MNCPLCNGKTAVRDVRVKGADLRRRRICLSCGHRFSTIEISTDDLATLTRRANNPDHLRATVRRIAAELSGLIE